MKHRWSTGAIAPSLPESASPFTVSEPDKAEAVRMTETELL